MSILFRESGPGLRERLFMRKLGMRRSARDRILARFLEQIQAAHLGHAHIAQNEIVQAPGEHFQGGKLLSGNLTRRRADFEEAQLLPSEHVLPGRQSQDVIPPALVRTGNVAGHRGLVLGLNLGLGYRETRRVLNCAKQLGPPGLPQTARSPRDEPQDENGKPLHSPSRSLSCMHDYVILTRQAGTVHAV